MENSTSKGVSNDNLGPSQEKHSIHDESNNKNRMPNTLQYPNGGFKYGPSPKRTPSGANIRQCRPSIPSYNTDSYTEFLLRLECLRNIEVEEVPNPGDYILRAMCMGQVYGHFPSGNVDLETTENQRTDDGVSSFPKNVDIYLDHDISFCIKFVDLIDNPLVLHLCRVPEDMDADSYDNIAPLGYICLDLGRLANYKPNRISEHNEPWHMAEKSQNRGRQNSRPGMVPSLQLTIECFGGFPDNRQLMQGNVMTVLCESFHNLPASVNQNVAHQDNSPDITLFMSLPHSKTDPVLKFRGAKYKETFLLEPTFRKMSIDEDTQTNSNVDVRSEQPSQKQAQGRKSLEHFSIQLNQAPREGRHWASIRDHFPDTPAEATVMLPDSTLDPVESAADAEREIFGDGREDFMEFSETGDPRLVWNSVHRKYIPVDNYRGMLARLSQNSIWPIEVCVAVKKKSADRQKKKKETVSNANKVVQQNAAEASGTQQMPNATTSNESSDRMLMGELGQQSSSAATEYSLIYHGMAFVDLSCLVHPGTKSARFSCRLVPFSTDLLQKKTCATESMVPESLLSTLSPKGSGDSNKVASSSTKRQPQAASTNNNTINAAGNAAASAKPVRPSQGSNQNPPADNQTSTQNNTLQHHGSITRRSDMGETTKKIHVHGHSHGSTDENIVGENVDGRNVIDRNPFIVFRISMLRSIVPCYKTSEISNVVEEFLPKRHLARRKPVSSSSAQQKYKKAILETAAEISHEFSEHYWKEILQNGQAGSDQSSSNNAFNETIKKGFLFYLNASGRYLILREHLRSAISNIVQQKCIILRPQGFHNHGDFQGYLHDIYVFLVDEMNEILEGFTAHETDPLKNNLDRLLQQTGCSQEDDLSKANLHSRQILDLGVYAEESLAQGDFETCHKLHLQRICRDKESSRCWMEFAIMWLARGDDRMAEIAVREALRKDPLQLYALLISGLIAVRHGDERGLECLGAALGLYPMAPEILVVVGIANSLLENHVVAEYFFRKAAHIHRLITGQPTDDIEKLFATNNTVKPFNMKQYTQDLDAGVSHIMETKPKVVLQVDDSLIDSQMQQVPRKKSKKSKSRVSKPDGNSVPTQKRERNSIRMSTNVNIAAASTVANTSATVGGGADEDTLIPKRSSKDEKSQGQNNGNENKSIVSGNPTLRSTETIAPQSTKSQPSNGPTFNFVENMSDILPEEMELPKLTPSLQSPYKITEFSETMEKHLLTIEYLEKIAGTKSSKQVKDQTESKGPSNVYIPKDEGVAPDNQIRKEYDSIINGPGEGVPARRSGSGSQTGTFRDSIDTISKSTASKSRRSSKTGTKRLSKEHKIQQKEKDKNGSTHSNPKPSELPINADQSVLESKLNVDPADIKQMTESLPQLPKLTDRLGTELIWAAELLLNLRLFDYVDGVLAKHLYFYGRRTLQFIYLRALSLYLRQREEEALPLIKEAIEYDSSNGMYYALEGHCYYVLGNCLEAIASYEKALKLPHTNENRHLLYLRYGSLCLDQGKSKIAKRVFLHGVTKYPTPYMWLALGSACFQRQEYDQAETAFAEGNRLDSTNPIAWGHLALSSLMQDKKSLAEQSYKWALRFGLKKGVLMNEIQRLQTEKGFGDPSFPRIPNCVPHDYYLRRMGRMKPFNLYKEALNQDPPRMGRDRYEDTENEMMLKKKLAMMRAGDGEEWAGEGEFEEEEGIASAASEGISNRPTQSTGFKIQTQSQRDGLTVQSAPPDMVTVMAPKTGKTKSQQ